MLGKAGYPGGIDAVGNRQRGSMVVLGAGTLVICISLLGLGANLGFWTFKKTVVADVAEAFAEPIFRNQVLYRELDYPDTETMVREMIDEMGLFEQLHDVHIEYTFSRGSDEDGWTNVGGDPDPTDDSERFNRVEVLVCTNMTDVSGMFTLSGQQVCQLGKAEIDEDNEPDEPDCLCSGPLNNKLKNVVSSTTNLACGGLLPRLCKKLDPVLEAGVDAVCQVESTADSAVDFVVTLLRDAPSANMEPVLKGVDCILRGVAVTVDTSQVAVLGKNVVSIEGYYTGFTE